MLRRMGEMVRTKALLVSLGMLLVSMLLLSPSPGSTAPSAPGILRVAVSSFGNEDIDPTMNPLVGIGVVGAPIYDWLVWPKPDGSLSPGIAESWTASPDQKSWTIKLRAMRFHNGDPLTAEDVKFSMNRAVRPEATTSFVGLWRSKLASVEVLTPNTFRVNLKSPWPTFPFALSPYEGTLGIVLPKNYFERVGEDGFRRNPVGTGPWEFVSHQPGAAFVYKARTTPHLFRAKPAFRQLEIRLVPEASTRIAALLAGEAWIAEITPTDVLQVKGGGLKVFSIEQFTHTALTFFGWGDARAKEMPTSNLKVRQALSIAVDRRALIRTVLNGFGEVPARFIISPGTVGYNAAWTREPYDPTFAKRLLAEAGYGSGFTINFYSAPAAGVAWIPNAVTAIAGFWRAIGVNTNIIPTDYGTMATMYRQNPYPERLLGSAMVNIAQVTKSNLSLVQAYYPANSPVHILPSPEIEIFSQQANAADTLDGLGEALRNMVEYAHREYVTFPLALTPALFAGNAQIFEWARHKSGYVGMSLETVR